MSVTTTQKAATEKVGKKPKKSPAISYCLVDGISLDKGLSLEIRRDLAPPVSGRGKKTSVYELVQVCQFADDLNQKAKEIGLKRNVGEAYLIASRNGDQGINDLRQIMKGYRTSYWMHNPQGRKFAKKGQIELKKRILSHREQYSNKYPKVKEVSLDDMLGKSSE